MAEGKSSSDSTEETFDISPELSSRTLFRCEEVTPKKRKNGDLGTSESEAKRKCLRVDNHHSQTLTVSNKDQDEGETTLGPEETLGHKEKLNSSEANKALSRPAEEKVEENKLHSATNDHSDNITIYRYPLSPINASTGLHLQSKNSPKIYFYAVQKGRQPGVYDTWEECEQQVKHFSGGTCKKCSSLKEAEDFVKPKEAEDFVKPKEAEDFVKPAKSSVINIPDSKNDFVDIFTDGSTVYNGPNGTVSGIGIFWGRGHPWNVSLQLPNCKSNNSAEIRAAIYALNQARQKDINNVRINTDSMFLIHGITVQIKEWELNDWKRNDGLTVFCKYDFIALKQACEGINVRFQHVKAHSGVPGNVEADKLASAASHRSL